MKGNSTYAPRDREQSRHRDINYHVRLLHISYASFLACPDIGVFTILYRNFVSTIQGKKRERERFISIIASKKQFNDNIRIARRNVHFFYYLL